MHGIILTRGIKHDMERWATEWQGKVLPFPYHDGQGNAIDSQMQFILQPIQLWSMVFPEVHKDVVLNTIFRGTDGHPINPAIRKFAWALRQSMGLEGMPEYKKDKHIPLFSPNADIIFIGLKKDNYYNFKKKEVVSNPTEEEMKDCFEML